MNTLPPPSYEMPSHGDNPLHELSMHDLVQELSYATHKHDTAAINEISDILLDKLADEETRRLEAFANERPQEIDTHTWNNYQSDILWDEVMRGPRVEKRDEQEQIPISVASYNLSQPKEQLEGKTAFTNGDTVLCNDTLRLYGVFDGVSGGSGKDFENAALAKQASQAASKAIESHYRHKSITPHTIQDATDQSREALIKAREAVIRYGGGGSTTATFFTIKDIQGQAYVVGSHAGDTRLFIQEEPKSPIISLTTDQSRGNYLLHGLFADAQPHLYDMDESFAYPIRIGSRIMLCSDGITGDREEQWLSEEEMYQAFDLPTAKEAAEKFIELSKKNDDKTVAVIDIEKPVEKPGLKPRVSGYSPAPAAGRLVHPYDTYERKRKKRRIFAALGALAVVGIAAAALIINKPGGDHTHTKPVHPPLPPSQPKQTPKKQPKHPKEPGLSRQERTLPLSYEGSTIWGQTTRYLQEYGYLTESPTINNVIIDSIKDEVLARQGKTEAAARDLPVGYTFTIPRHSLKRAQQLKKTLTSKN